MLARHYDAAYLAAGAIGQGVSAGSGLLSIGHEILARTIPAQCTGRREGCLQELQPEMAIRSSADIFLASAQLGRDQHECWDHASLFAAGTSPAACSPKRAAAAAAAEEAQPWWWGNAGRGLPGPPSFELEETDSPLDGWEVELVDRRAFRQLGPAVRHSGWLLKAYGEGPQRIWRSRFVFLTADRLCYTPDPDVEGVRYLPLDRIPVRALPRGYGPKLGVTIVEDRQARGEGAQGCGRGAGSCCRWNQLDGWGPRCRAGRHGSALWGRGMQAAAPSPPTLSASACLDA